MGAGSYDYSARTVRATTKGFFSDDLHSVFKARKIQSGMMPQGIVVRESRDSDEHPNSMAVIVALDETGSMGKIPHEIIKDGLPTIMKTIMDAGEKDPQILFLGIGDHLCDQAPLQVGQFETSDEKLDKWLADLYLEGNGGGNGGESYLLAWYFAARHTSIDCFEKRGRKGILFTIGDEPTLPNVDVNTLKRLMGDGEYQNYTAQELLSLAKEKYDVYHILITETTTGSRPETLNGWRKLLGENVLIVDDYKNVAQTIAKMIIANKVVSGETQTVPDATITNQPITQML